MIVYLEIMQKQAQDRKTHFEICRKDPVACAPTKTDTSRVRNSPLSIRKSSPPPSRPKLTNYWVNTFLCIPFVRIQSGNNSKIVFLSICICYEIKIISKSILICCALPFKLQRTALSASAMKINN